jgi:hypothetical protein
MFQRVPNKIENSEKFDSQERFPRKVHKIGKGT